MRTIYQPFLWLSVLIMVWVVPARTMADEATISKQLYFLIRRYRGAANASDVSPY
ncbi:MAG: hypothetical protein IJM04_12750 [Prevotella sp.]|nr:hypothetical protein [Prevotella sp.]